MAPELTSAIAVGALIVASLALLLVLLLVLFMAWRGWRRRRRRWAPAADDSPTDLAPAVDRALGRLDELTTRVEGMDRRLPVVEDQGRRSVQRVGVVRFNPFEDTGGNQSFALALLDSKQDGIVISSLHSRQQTRVYLKTIVAGKCETALSDEESEALRRAGVS
jgi:hypothetical protein